MTPSDGISRLITVKSSSYVRNAGGGELGARSSSHMRSSNPSELTPKRTPECPDFENDSFFKGCRSYLLTGGCILPVRHQGETNSCYAFTVITTIHGAAGGQEAGEGSVQELVDFLHRPNHSTGPEVPKSGLPNNFENAYNYIKSYGIYSEKEYPWEGQCRSNAKLPTLELKIYIDDFKHLEDRKLIMEQLDKQPLAGAIVVTDRFLNWKSDKEEIYDWPTAEAQKQGRKDHAPNHAVTLVGYGKYKEKDYYLCQNSYGTNWGYFGYFKVFCDKVSHVSYPLNVCKKNKNLVGININAQDEKGDVEMVDAPEAKDDVEMVDASEMVDAPEAKDDVEMVDAHAMETE